MAIQLDRKQCEFITDVGLITFPKVFPGQAEPSAEGSTTQAYKTEHVTPTCSQSLISAVSYVASMFDSKQINPATGRPIWERHVFGPLGRLKKLEEMAGRDPAKYPYAVGKYVYNLSKPVSLKMIKMEGKNLADPVVRAEYDKRINEAAPKVVKFLDRYNPVDLDWVQQENQTRAFRNLPPISEETMHQITRPLRSDELWAGCNVRIAGRAYWNEHKKTVSLFLEQIMLVSQGERLAGGEASPDQVFGAFAPAADLAPVSAGQSQQDDPWAAMR